MEYSNRSEHEWHHHSWGSRSCPPVLPLIGAFLVLFFIVSSGLWLPLLIIGALFFFFRPMMMHGHWRRGGWRGHMPGRPPFEGRPPFGFGGEHPHRHPMGRHGHWRQHPGWFGEQQDDSSAEKPKRQEADTRFV